MLEEPTGKYDWWNILEESLRWMTDKWGNFRIKIENIPPKELFEE